MLKIVFLCSLILSVFSANAITITQTVPSNVLFDLTLVAPTDAGDYFNDSYTRDTTLLSISSIPLLTNWRVSAKLSTFIHSGSQKIQVQLKRTGIGLGIALPVGGTSYETLNATTYTTLFTGVGSRLSIPMRTRIKGIGVSDEYGTFDSIIQYKVETY